MTTDTAPVRILCGKSDRMTRTTGTFRGDEENDKAGWFCDRCNHWHGVSAPILATDREALRGTEFENTEEVKPKRSTKK